MIEGYPVDARTDLFAVGAILFEMLAGRPAFSGRTMTTILHATLTEEPPPLAGSAHVAAVDRVIRHALAKKPEGRPASADAMAGQLNAVRSLEGHQSFGVRSVRVSALQSSPDGPDDGDRVLHRVSPRHGAGGSRCAGR